jgi:integrase
MRNRTTLRWLAGLLLALTLGGDALGQDAKEPFGTGSDEDRRQRQERLGSAARPRKGAGAPRPSGERAYSGRQRVARDGHGFHDAYRPLFDPRNMLRECYRLRNQAHLPKIRFHDLRHSAATILNMAGIRKEAIKELLGHASVRTTQEAYMHLTPGGERQAADKMDEILGPVAVKTAKGRGN